MRNPKTDPRLTPLAQSLPATVPFVGPETQERSRGASFVARLGANENGFGPSPRAIAAMSAAAADAWQYGDPESYTLRAALAVHHEVAMENVLIGEGIDGLLGDTVRLFIGPGDRVVTSAGAYPTFNYHVTGYGGEIHQVPYENDHENPEALMARAAEVGAKLVYLANPDNPMGSWHDGDRIVQALDMLPDGALLILDEAYLEFAPEGTAAVLPIDDPRVQRFRTFSKAYGMAGARIGYVLGQADLIATYHRVRNHFGVNRIAQAGALAALADQEWLAHVQAQIRTARTRISEIASANGLTALRSATNFVTLDCAVDGAFARKVLAELRARDIFVRMPLVAPQDRCIRISCGPETGLSAFEFALPKALAAARAGSP